MKFRLALILFAVIAGGCPASGPDRANSNASPSGSNDRNAPVPAENRAAEGAAGAPRPEFKTLSFEAKNLPPAFKYEGRVTGGAKWTDANGENTLIVSEKTEKGADASNQKIWAYLYAVRDGETKLLWKIQDNAENYCDSGKGLTSPVDVRDLDGDGVAENMFVYNLAGACDVSPIPYKLMMHSGEKKLAVRGANAVEISGYDQKSEKNFDPAFDAAPKEFRRAASDFWDRHVKPLRAE
jgi:hypothetical protein